MIDEQVKKLLSANNPENHKLAIALIIGQTTKSNVLSVLVTLKDSPTGGSLASEDVVQTKINTLLKESNLFICKNILDYSYSDLYKTALTKKYFRTPDNLEITLRSYHNYLDSLYINATNTLKNDKGHNTNIKGASI
jgi:hypothetical protein